MTWATEIPLTDRTREAGASGEGDMAPGVPQLPPTILSVLQEADPDGRGSPREREEKRAAQEEAVPQASPTPGTGVLRGQGGGELDRP